MKMKNGTQYIKGAEKHIQNSENDLNNALTLVKEIDPEHKQQIKNTLKSVDEALIKAASLNYIE